MRFSFAFKLSLWISLLALLLTGPGAAIYYFQTRALIVAQLRERMSELSRAGVLTFNDEHREAIRRIVQEVRDHSGLDRPERRAALSELTEEDSLELLSSERSQRIMTSPEFIGLAQALRRVREFSRKTVRHQQTYEPLHLIADSDDPPLVEYAFLFIKIPEFPDGRYLVYIADGDYEPVDANGDGDFEDDDDYAGNPPGNLFVPPTPEMIAAFESRTALAEQDFTTDKWGTWLSGFAPVLDRDGEVLAVLGVDLSVSNEANQLARVRDTGILIAIGAQFVAVLMGILIAGILTRPIRVLRQGAQRVGARNFATRIEVQSHDELGQLADTFNQMVADLESYTAELEDLSRVRAVLEQSNQMKTEIIAKVNHELQTPLLGVLANLDSIKMAVQRGELESAEELIRKSINYSIYQRTLINNMIYATASDVRSPFYVDPEDVADLVDCVEKAATLTYDVHEGEIAFSGKPPEEFIPCQTEILMIILVNIFSNCAEHAHRTRILWKRDGAFIELAAESEPRVPVDAEEALEPWKSTRINTTRPILGLGMNIVREILATMNGAMDVHASAGRFIVTLRLPVAASVG